MNTTTLPNWAFTILLILGLWGLLVTLCVIGIWALILWDEIKARREKRKLDAEYAQMYRSMIGHIENEQKHA